MSKLAEQMKTYVKMVSDNLIKEKHYPSIHHVLQDFPKDVEAFKKNPNKFPLEKHKEFFNALFNVYSNSGEMPHEVVKASSKKYKAQWITDKLHDEISGQEPDDFDPHDVPNDDFDMDLEYDDDWDTLGVDPYAYENNKVKEELPHTEGPPLADKIHDSLHNTWMNGGEEALQAEMKMDDKDWQNAITDISINTGWHQDDDREEIITKIIDDYVDNYATGESTTPISKMKHLAGIKEDGNVYSTETPHGDDLKDSTIHGLLDQIEDYYHKETGDNGLDVQISDDHVYIGDAKFEIYKNGEDLGYDLPNELEREDISIGRGPYQHKLQGDDLEKSKTMTPDEIKQLAGL